MGASGKNKLIITTPVHKRSAVEVRDHLPQAFPCIKGIPFEDVSQVYLASLDYCMRKEIMNSPSYQCYKYIQLYFPPPEQWTSSAGGEAS